uniref:Transposon Ty3-I Gag-Pol polyprotein n=1 Tax=Cajanus cajan TaxID=3821 RepID=A0A151TZ00_CAJCA|nr:Transposon Ty3-I Gag-Pol polyprotein [Cajanus cajan]
MEEFSTLHSDSNSSDYNDISKVAHDLRSLKIWKEQEAKYRLKEKLEREAQLALLEEEHDGLTNKITFTHKGKKFVLHPLLPSQVIEDQAQMKTKREQEQEKILFTTLTNFYALKNYYKLTTLERCRKEMQIGGINNTTREKHSYNINLGGYIFAFQISFYFFFFSHKDHVVRKRGLSEHELPRRRVGHAIRWFGNRGNLPAPKKPIICKLVRDVQTGTDCSSLLQVGLICTPRTGHSETRTGRSGSPERDVPGSKLTQNGHIQNGRSDFGTGRSGPLLKSINRQLGLISPDSKFRPDSLELEISLFFSHFLSLVFLENIGGDSIYLPHVEFAYNRVVHKTTNMSPFEIVYGFNPLTPLDLLPLPDVASFIHKEGTSRAEFVKNLHERVRNHIQSQTEKYAKYNNKGRKEVVFNEGDWVWLHLRKDRFPSKRKSKLSPRGDGPFQILKKINNNVYVLDLPSEYGVSPSFNVSDLSLFTGLVAQEEDALDLRTNPLQEGGDDGGGPWAKGPTTRAMAKRIQEEWAHAQEKPIILFSWALNQAQVD